MKDLYKIGIGIDGPDGSGKDFLIDNIFGEYKILKCGGAGKNEKGNFEFSEKILLMQYSKLFNFLKDNQKIVLNRTIISFLVGKIVDGDLTEKESIDLFEILLLNKKIILNEKNIIITCDKENIKNILLKRKELGELSSYDNKLLESDTLISEIKELFLIIGKKIKNNYDVNINFIKNDFTKHFLKDLKNIIF